MRGIIEFGMNRMGCRQRIYFASMVSSVDILVYLTHRTIHVYFVIERTVLREAQKLSGTELKSPLWIGNNCKHAVAHLIQL